MRLRVESDGDRHPKDVYIVDEEGTRICTMDFVGCGCVESRMLRIARALCDAWNRGIWAVENPDNKQ